MAAIGTTTAMAIVPPEDNPLDFLDEFGPMVASAEGLVEEVLEYAEFDASVSGAVEVRKMVVGGAVPPVDAGVSVITEV